MTEANGRSSGRPGSGSSDARAAGNGPAGQERRGRADHDPPAHPHAVAGRQRVERVATRVAVSRLVAVGVLGWIGRLGLLRPIRAFRPGRTAYRLTCGIGRRIDGVSVQSFRGCTAVRVRSIRPIGVLGPLVSLGLAAGHRQRARLGTVSDVGVLGLLGGLRAVGPLGVHQRVGPIGLPISAVGGLGLLGPVSGVCDSCGFHGLDDLGSGVSSFRRLRVHRRIGRLRSAAGPDPAGRSRHRLRVRCHRNTGAAAEEGSPAGAPRSEAVGRAGGRRQGGQGEGRPGEEPEKAAADKAAADRRRLTRRRLTGARRRSQRNPAGLERTRPARVRRPVPRRLRRSPERRPSRLPPRPARPALPRAAPLPHRCRRHRRGLARAPAPVPPRRGPPPVRPVRRRGRERSHPVRTSRTSPHPVRRASATSASSASSAADVKPLYRPEPAEETKAAAEAPQSRFPQPAAPVVGTDGDARPTASRRRRPVRAPRCCPPCRWLQRHRSPRRARNPRPAWPGVRARRGSGCPGWIRGR